MSEDRKRSIETRIALLEVTLENNTAALEEKVLLLERIVFGLITLVLSGVVATALKVIFTGTP